MKRFSIILLGALAIFMAGCSKNIEPSSPDPDAWKYDVTLPVPIEFGTPSILTKADRIEDIASATGEFGVFAISKTATDLTPVSRPGDGREKLLYNQSAYYKEGTFELVAPAYYPLSNSWNYNFYSYYTRIPTQNLVISTESQRITVDIAMGNDDVLYGNSKVTGEMQEEAGNGYNARYIRKVRSLESVDKETETYTDFNPNISFRHVTTSLQFNVMTTEEGAKFFKENNVWVSGLSLDEIATKASLCLVDLSSDDYSRKDTVMNPVEGTFTKLITTGSISGYSKGTAKLNVLPTGESQKLCDPMFLVPQNEPITGSVTLRNSTAVFDTVVFTLDPAEMKDSNDNPINEFKAGHYYTITLKVHSPEQIFISVDVQGWIDGLGGEDYEQEIG